MNQTSKKTQALAKMAALEKAARRKNVEMAAEPIKLEDRAYSWNEFQKTVKGKQFFDPKTFDQMSFAKLDDKTKKRIWGKWNARFPMSSQQALEGREKGIRATEETVMSVNVKKALLERAAENAFQNKDAHLASALYDELEKVADDSTGDVPEPQKTNEHSGGDDPYKFDPAKA